MLTTNKLAETRLKPTKRHHPSEKIVGRILWNSLPKDALDGIKFTQVQKDMEKKKDKLQNGYNYFHLSNLSQLETT